MILHSYVVYEKFVMLLASTINGYFIVIAFGNIFYHLYCCLRFISTMRMNFSHSLIHIICYMLYLLTIDCHVFVYTVVLHFCYRQGQFAFVNNVISNAFIAL